MYSLPNISQSYNVRGNGSKLAKYCETLSQDSIFPFFLPYLLPMIHIALTGSVYTTIAVAVERCVTVMAPFTQIKVRSISQIRRVEKL